MKFENFLMKSSFLGVAYCKTTEGKQGMPTGFKVLDCNGTFEKITGLKKSHLLGNRFKKNDSGSPSWVNDWIDAFGDDAWNGREKELEQYFVSEKKWVKVHIYSSDMSCFTVALMEVSQQKKKKEELNNFFEMSLDLHCITDLDGHLLKINSAWTEILGYNEQELLGKVFLDFVHSDDMEITKNAMNSLRAGKQVQSFVNRYQTKFGSYRFIEWRSRPEGNRIYAVARDITIRKEKEEVMVRERELLRTILDHSPDSIYVKDSKARKVIANPVDCYYSGVEEEEELLGKTDFDLYPEEVAEEFFKDDQNVLKLGHTVKNREEKIIGPNGESGWLLTTKIPLRDGKGNITGLLGIGRDITNRRHAETERQNFLERIEQLGEHLPGFIYQFLLRPDGSSCLPLASKGIEKVFGVSAEDVKSDAGPVFDVLNPNDLQSVSESIQHSADNISHWRESFRVNLPSGETIWVEGSATPQKLDNGSILWHGYIQDITEQKKVEIELNKLSVAVEQSPTSIMITNQDGVTEYVNPKFVEMTGYTFDEVVGEKPSLLKSGKQSDEFYKKLWETISSGKSWRGDLLNRKKNGDLFWESASITPIIDTQGNITHYLGVKEDITERKSAEKQLSSSKKLIEESEKKYRAIFEKGLVSILVADDNGKYLSANEAACNLLGYSAEEIEGMSINDIKTTDELGADNSYKDFIRTGGDSGEFEFITKSGDHKVAFYKATRVKKDFNISMLVDITDQKEIEKKLMKAKQHAEEASKAKSQFLAKMSHELRTPLNGVIGFTDILSETSLTAVQKQYVESANVSGRNLLRIINDILDLSKVEAGMMELDIVRTDIYELIANSVDIVKLSAGRKKLELLLYIDPALPRNIFVDPVRLSQILSNLLSNAIKFTEDGEVELQVIYRPANSERGSVHFSIRDTGIGITSEQKKKLFKAFSQADSSMTRKFGGTGLGLTISQRIAEMMGGRIEFESTPGSGSRFFFELELEVEPGEPQEEIELAMKRCLIADDNERSRAILSLLLNGLGLDFVECESGQEAIKILESDPEGFDVLICDNDMPGMSGRETVKMIREKLNIPFERLRAVLLLTSSDEIEARGDSLHPEDVCCMNKPVKPEKLFRCLSGKPAAAEMSEMAGPITATHRQSNEKTKILVAEDVPMNMQLISALLRSVMPRADILKAEDGNYALELYKKQKPDMVLMDVQMPIMDGLEATREIRKLERQTGNHTMIVALTAAAMKEDRQKCLDAGMDAVITKPIDPGKLKDILTEAMAMKENL